MKFEFGDLYKFVVSAGLALATVAVLLLWLLLKEPFDLQLKDADIKVLTATAQDALHQRQAIVAALMHHVRWATPAGVLLGLGIAGWGLRRWSKLQHLADKHAELDLQAKQAAVRPKTDDEVAEKEATDLPLASDTTVRAAELSSNSSDQAVEKRLAHKLEQLLPHHQVQHDMMVGDTGIDFILRGRSMLEKDYLVELKLIKKGFNADWLKQTALVLRSAALVYEQATGRRPSTCLVVAVDDAAWGTRNYPEIRERVLDSLSRGSAKHQIAVIKSSELEALDAETARDKLGLPSRRAG